MYSDIKSVQILVALLKKYNIRKVVVSPGNRNVPIVHSLEQDPFFTTYSVVDERSAGFFGIGLIQRYREPVAICCTSGTAVCNYYSAIAEAFYQKLPLLVITADRNPDYLNQDEEQMIPQTAGFKAVTKAIAELPLIKNESDEYICKRKICEAILELSHHGCGPVQINVPIEKKVANFHTENLPEVNPICRHNLTEDWRRYAHLLKKKKVYVLYGQSAPLSSNDLKIVEEFAMKTGAVIDADILSNLHCKGSLSTFYLSRAISADYFMQHLKPDIVITLNGGYVSYVRNHLKSCKGRFEHWAVNPAGMVVDPFQSITDVFEASPIDFLKRINELLDNAQSDCGFYEKWNEEIQKIADNDDQIPYSNLYLAKEFAKMLPDGSKLHVANSSSIRMLSHFSIPDTVEVFGNRGTNGIDGSASSYVAMASTVDAPAYLLIGDLSFFYDMNSLWNNHITPNMRIVLNNNEGATLFHYTVGKETVPSLNRNIAAEHHASAKGWVESRGFEYLSVHNESDWNAAAVKLAQTDQEKPLFVEVFTDKETDAQVLKNFYKNKQPKTFIEKGKDFIKSLI